MESFRRMRRMRRCKPHQTLFSEGEQPQGFFILCAGDVKVVKEDQRGRELILMYLSCGDLVGDAAYFSGQPYCVSAEVMRESVICFLPKELCEELSAREPEFSRRLLQRAGRDLCRSMERTFNYAFRSAYGRLAGFLLTSRAPVASCRLPVNYSRREIAANLGLSPETVIRALSVFQKRGFIRVSGKTIEVCDRAGLEDMIRVS
ncbi:MAG: Crp/Fnr family transcriptional regulator [Elusimicrobiota bacterium]